MRVRLTVEWDSSWLFSSLSDMRRYGRHSIPSPESLKRCCCLGIVIFLFRCLPLGLMAAGHIQGPRAQIDRKLYKKHMQHEILNYPNLHVRSGSVFDFVLNQSLPPSHEPGSSRNVWATIAGIRLGIFLPLSAWMPSPLIPDRHR